MDKTLTGLTGEYYVLAQLTHHGLVATLTLSNTKGVDILVTNQELRRLYKVEVKTTELPPRAETLFGPGKFYMWAMSKKHEMVKDPALFYCFVALQGATVLPRFFVVPSSVVARYVKWQHQKWLDSRKHTVAETTMRRFRIPVQDPDGYENNWKVFG
jgi:hypothetical protein